MTILQFPNNYDDYMRLGLQAYEKGEYQVAIDHLSKAYKIKPTHDIHELMVRSYTCLGEYQEAKSLVVEELDKYLTDTDGIELYFDLLCETKEWITAHELIVKYDFLRPKIERLEFLEKADQVYRKEEIDQIKEALKVSKNKSPLYQMTIWKKAKFLPFDVYLATVKYNLVQEDLCLLVRSHLLDCLRKLQIKTKVKYLDINQEIIEVIPKSLPTIQTDHKYQVFITEVSNLLVKQPDLYTQIRGILPFVFYCLLPKIDIYLQEPKKFAKLFLRRFGLTSEFNLVETEVEKDLMDKIQKQIIKLG